MGLHLFQRQGQDRRERLGGRRAEADVIGLQVADGSFSFAPTDKEQRCTVAAGLGQVVGKSVDGVRLTVHRTERRRTPVYLLVTA